MQVTLNQRIVPLLCLVLGLGIYWVTFDRGLLDLVGPAIFVLGLVSSFRVIRRIHGNSKAAIPITLWVIAILVNRITGSYSFYSKYDFIDPMDGFFLSVIIALLAFCMTIFYIFRRRK